MWSLAGSMRYMQVTVSITGPPDSRALERPLDGFRQVPLSLQAITNVTAEVGFFCVIPTNPPLFLPIAHNILEAFLSLSVERPLHRFVHTEGPIPFLLQKNIFISINQLRYN